MQGRRVQETDDQLDDYYKNILLKLILKMKAEGWSQLKRILSLIRSVS